MDAARAKRLAKELSGKAVSGWSVATNEFYYGKSAVVFRAQKGKTPGALKVFDPELIERFGKGTQEERINRELSLRGKEHPNLVKIFDGGYCKDTELYFVVMEFIDAPNLETILQELPRAQIFPIISQVAGAAEFLESLGIAHRDIKPSNILISLDFQKATLLDLGVIRPIGVEGLTDDEQRPFIGTLRYSPPELVFRTEQDTVEGWRAITFYQLGGVLHDMIQRKPLFQEYSEPFARLVEAVKGDIPILDAVDVSPDLIVLCKNSLLKDPQLRRSLLGWSEFQQQVIPQNPATAAKDRIRKRQASYQRSADQNLEAEQEAHKTRQTLEEIKTRIESAIHLECVGSGLFPPIEIHEWNDPNPGETHFCVVFCESRQKDLLNPVSIKITLKVLDRRSQALHLELLAGLSPKPLERGSFRKQTPITIYKGVFEESVLKKAIHDSLYMLLDIAQQTANNKGSSNKEPMWLHEKLTVE